ncbi:MAG TPA: FtsQ-type POTRA domain-containing protein [Coriobacteriia bacterium]|nr:FtsQ-type POTRA domain-containing protein [Coriobacteriia bacterium]
MASNSHRKSGSSARSGPRKRVVIGAEETTRVRYRHNEPEVESERHSSRSRSADSRRAKQPPSRAGKRLSNAKREQREQRQRSIRTRRAAFGLVAAVLLGALLWGCIALYRAPIFVIKTTVVDGEKHFSEAEILAIAQVPENATLLRVPVRDVEERLKADPWIRDATVQRDFPSTLRVSVKERTPAAIVDAGGSEIWVVSQDGHWLGKRSEDDTGLVTVTAVEQVTPRRGGQVLEPEVTNAARVLAGISPSLRKKVRSVSAPTVEETALKTKGDVEIFVGEATAMAEKDRIIREILRKQDGVVYINVRVTDRPTWRGLE